MNYIDRLNKSWIILLRIIWGITKRSWIKLNKWNLHSLSDRIYLCVSMLQRRVLQDLMLIQSMLVWDFLILRLLVYSLTNSDTALAKTIVCTRALFSSALV